MDITNLDFGYRSAEKILNGLSLQLVPGEKHGILGVNGAGKTTLFRLLSGQMKPNAGTITHQDLPLRREQVSFLEAEPYFYPYMTGMEYLRFINDQPDQIERWNSLFDLPLPHYAEEYSTGMKKKLGLIGVLLQENRPLLILDEPFNGVDFESNEIIMSVLKQNYTSTRTVLISSHILPTLTRICQRISVLQNGCINRTYEQSEFGELEKMVQIDVDLKVSEALR
jgi:ABC-2 type transport system ATP-binding protein